MEDNVHSLQSCIMRFFSGVSLQADCCAPVHLGAALEGFICIDLS